MIFFVQYKIRILVSFREVVLDCRDTQLTGRGCEATGVQSKTPELQAEGKQSNKKCFNKKIIEDTN
tara:strand:+ start:40 stop:237 length:198 start_codon:yes stop_codon:yes gene_type:complete